MKRLSLHARIPALLLTLSLILFSCIKDAEELPELGSENQIVSFTLMDANGVALDSSSIAVTIVEDSIKIVVPSSTDITKLKPQVEITGVSVLPASGTVQNFSAPVIYTVTAENGDTHKYVVSISKATTGNIVYIGSGDKNFYALDINTGKLKWKYTGTASFAYSSPTYQDGVVYVGGIDSYVYAFDALTGNVIWRFKAGDTGIESDAVVSGTTVYVGSNDDNLYALDAKTGALKWKFNTGANISASPVIMNDMVYFGSSDWNLYALQASSGQYKWSFTTGAMINQSGPSLVDGVIYFGSRDQYLYAINAASGTLKWKFATSVSLEQSSPTVVNGVVYIGGWYDISNFQVKGSLYAVNANTGALIWEGLKNIGISSSPCVSNGILYISCDDGNFYALNASGGNVLWKKEILPNGASAAVAQGKVFVGGGGSRYIYAFDAVTGAEKWKFPVPDGLMTSSPLIIGASGDAYHSGDSGMQF